MARQPTETELRREHAQFIRTEGRFLFVQILGAVESCRQVLEDLRASVVVPYRQALADVLEAHGLELPTDDEVAALDISEGEPRWLDLVVNVALPVVGHFIQRPDLDSPPKWPVFPAVAVASARTAGIALREWCDRHHVRDAWLRDLINVVCSRWAFDRAAAGRLDTDAGGWTPYDPHAVPLTFEDRGWSPGLESWEHFEGAALEAFTQFLREEHRPRCAARPDGLRMPHALADHLEWLARWQLGAETQDDVADDVGRDRTAVSRAVRGAAARIGLTLKS